MNRIQSKRSIDTFDAKRSTTSLQSLDSFNEDARERESTPTTGMKRDGSLQAGLNIIKSAALDDNLIRSDRSESDLALAIQAAADGDTFPRKGALIRSFSSSTLQNTLDGLQSSTKSIRARVSQSIQNLFTSDKSLNSSRNTLNSSHGSQSSLSDIEKTIEPPSKKSFTGWTAPPAALTVQIPAIRGTKEVSPSPKSASPISPAFSLGEGEPGKLMVTFISSLESTKVIERKGDTSQTARAPSFFPPSLSSKSSSLSSLIPASGATPPMLNLRISTPKLNLGGAFKLKQKLAKNNTVPTEIAEDSLADLPEEVRKSKIKMINSEKLTEWLFADSMKPVSESLPPSPVGEQRPSVSESRASLIMLDLRNFVEFNSEHVLGSFNVSIPEMMCRRFRKGSLQFFNLERFITSEAGKSAWRERKEKDRIVIFDEHMPDSPGGVTKYEFKCSVVGNLFNSLEKEVEQTVWLGELYWLRGGYSQFLNYCRSSEKIVTSNGETVKLPNMRWIDIQSEQEQAPSLATPEPVPLGQRLQLNEISMSDSSLASPMTPITFKVPTGSGKGLLSSIGSKLRPRTTSGNTKHDAEPQSPNSRDPQSTDYSAILPWLYLGADPAIITSISNVTSFVDDEVNVDLVSPVLPKMDMLAIDFQQERVKSQERLEIPKQPSQKLHVKATIQKLKRLKVSFILNMAQECPNLMEAFCNNNVENPLKDYEKIGIFDYADEDIDPAIGKAVSALKRFHEQDPDGVVYVHCRAGRSRSGTAVIAYLMEVNGWTLEQAYEHVKMRRPAVSPNIGFMGALQKLENLRSAPA